MSKPPAKLPAKARASAPAKPAAKPGAAARKPAEAKKPAGKPAAAASKPTPHRSVKPIAKGAPAAKPAAKSAAPAPSAKAAKPAKTAPKHPAAPAAAKHAVVTVAKAAHAAAAPTPKPEGTSAARHPAPTAAAKAAMPAPLSKPAQTSSAAKAAAAQASASSSSAALSAATPISNRFTDRFAPPRPIIHEVIEASTKPPKKIDPKLANAWKTKAGRELSDDELLAMPDSEYMNEKQLEFFRTRLTQQKDDLLSNAGETTEHLREDTSIVPDPVDRATIEEEHALELRTRDRERKLLKKISQSLARLESGDYGYCDETGEPIGVARLLARPTATLSLEAQQRRELKQKMFGD